MSTVLVAVLRPGIGRAEDRGVAGWTTSVRAGGIDVRCLADPAEGRTVFAGTHWLGALRAHVPVARSRGAVRIERVAALLAEANVVAQALRTASLNRLSAIAPGSARRS